MEPDDKGGDGGELSEAANATPRWYMVESEHVGGDKAGHAPVSTGKPRSRQPLVPSTMLKTQEKPAASNKAAPVFDRQVEFG